MWRCSRCRSRARRWMMCSCTMPDGRCGMRCRTRRRRIARSCYGGGDMHRTWAIIERELRRFRRSPTLIVISMVFPLVQLVVLGYAFGGNVKHLKVGVVDQDHGVPAIKIRELCSAISSGAGTIDPVDYSDQGQALTDLRNGRLNGVLTIPPGFSRRTLARADPHIALVEDNTDSFVSST